MLYLHIYKNNQLMTLKLAVFPFPTLRLEFAIALCSADSFHLIVLNYLKVQESEMINKR